MRPASARPRGWWRRGVAALGVLVALVVASAPTMPAVTAQARRASVSVSAQEAAAGDPITVTVDATAAEDQPRTAFRLRADAQNAGISPDVSFTEQGTAQLGTEDGGTVSLQAVPGQDGGSSHLFALERDGSAWYLAGVQKTGWDGKTSWGDLTRAEYGLVEVKAPDGYELPVDPWVTVTVEEWASRTEVLTVESTHGFVLPSTGGAGAGPAAGIGLAVAAGALVPLVRRSRRRLE